jgi:hypothetical protein
VSDAGVYIDISIVGIAMRERKISGDLSAKVNSYTLVECASLPISSNLATITFIEGSRDGC